jgi:hypothetical protein
MKKILILACTLALAGCAGMSAEKCKSTDWFWLGQKDGYEAAPPYTGSMLDTYTAECAVHASKPDAAAYAKGLESGQQNRLYWWGPPGWP